MITSAEVLTAEDDERRATTSALRREESHQALTRTLTRILHAPRTAFGLGTCSGQGRHISLKWAPQPKRVENPESSFYTSSLNFFSIFFQEFKGCFKGFKLVCRILCVFVNLHCFRAFHYFRVFCSFLNLCEHGFGLTWTSISHLDVTFYYIGGIVQHLNFKCIMCFQI
jgi:hypothetical protein